MESWPGICALVLGWSRGNWNGGCGFAVGQRGHSTGRREDAIARGLGPHVLLVVAWPIRELCLFAREDGALGQSGVCVVWLSAGRRAYLVLILLVLVIATASGSSLPLPAIIAMRRLRACALHVLALAPRGAWRRRYLSCRHVVGVCVCVLVMRQWLSGWPSARALSSVC